MDGRRECEEIRYSREILDLYSYVNILSFSLTYIHTQQRTLYHSVLSTNVIVFSMFDCLKRQRKRRHCNSELFHKLRPYTKWTHQDSPRNRSTNSISTDFGKSSLYVMHGICIGIAYR